MANKDSRSDGQIGLESLAIYTDYPYHRQGNEVYAERAFALFLAQIAESIPHCEVIGRLHKKPGRSHYRLPKKVRFTPLPYYESAARPWSAIPAMARSVKHFWRVLDRVGTVWLLGPHPLSICFCFLAGLRRKRVVLGVRQDTMAYARSRHPKKPMIQLAARVLDIIYRLLACVYPVVVVGPELARRYRNAPHIHELTVSLIKESEIATEIDRKRPFGSEGVKLLSIGRLDKEKNPLMLADILSLLHEGGLKWHLTVCGEGPLEGEIKSRFAELDLSNYVDVRGYVPFDEGLREEYYRSDIFLHVSWTEGLPQVLAEAFAEALPVVATDVGGISAAVKDAALLVPPGDTDAAVTALLRIANDEVLRTKLVSSGLGYARAHTLESECQHLVSFLADSTSGLSYRSTTTG